MKIIVRRKVMGISQDAEQMVRAALAHLTDKIFIESVHVKDESEVSQLITINFRSQGSAEKNSALEALVRKELAMRGDLEVSEMDSAPVFVGRVPMGWANPMLEMGGFGLEREAHDDTQPRHYEPLHVPREREENYTRKTLITFSLRLDPQAASDEIAFSVRTTLFNRIFSFMGAPCLTHRELYERTAIGKIMTIGCSLTFLSNKIDAAALKQRLLGLQKSIPGIDFVVDGIDVVGEHVDAPKTIYVCRKPMYVLQGWDAVKKQVLSESCYETDTHAMQPKNSESRRFERDARGQITKITFEYARPEVDCCELSPVHIMQLPALKSTEQQDGSTKYEVNTVFFSCVAADATYRRSLLNGSITGATVEYVEIPDKDGSYRPTGNISTRVRQQQVTPVDNSNPYNYFATLIEQNESLREDCVARVVTKIELTKSKTKEITANISSNPKFELTVGIAKEADPAILKTALSKLERLIFVVSIKPTEECVEGNLQKFCVCYCLLPHVDLTTNLEEAFRAMAIAEKLRMFTLTRPPQLILAPGIKMVGQEGDTVSYGVAVNLFKVLASDEELRHALLKGDIIEVRMIFKEVLGQPDSFTYTGKLNLVSQGVKPPIIPALLNREFWV